MNQSDLDRITAQKGYSVAKEELRALKAMAVCPVAPKPRLRQSSKPNETNTDRQIPHPVAQRDQAPALGATIRGEAKSLVRTIVRFVGYRVKPLDPDNFAGSVKDLLDGLRHAGLIRGDEHWQITLETSQERVGTFKEERTEITIEWP